MGLTIHCLSTSRMAKISFVWLSNYAIHKDELSQRPLGNSLDNCCACSTS